jgi:hypothetical protein
VRFLLEKKNLHVAKTGFVRPLRRQVRPGPRPRRSPLALPTRDRRQDRFRFVHAILVEPHRAARSPAPPSRDRHEVPRLRGYFGYFPICKKSAIFFFCANRSKKSNAFSVRILNFVS